MPTNEVFVTVNLRINKTGTASTDARDLVWEQSISNIIQGEQDKIREDIRQRVRETLGDRSFRVKGLYVGRGSVETLVLLGIAYAGVRDYKTVRDSLDKIMLDVRQVLSNHLVSRGDASVDDAWYETLGLGPRTGLVQLFEGISLPLVFYLVLSNVILVGFLVYVVLPLARQRAETTLFLPTQFQEIIALLLVVYVGGLVLVNMAFMVLFWLSAFTMRRNLNT